MDSIFSIPFKFDWEIMGFPIEIPNNGKFIENLDYWTFNLEPEISCRNQNKKIFTKVFYLQRKSLVDSTFL